MALTLFCETATVQADVGINIDLTCAEHIMVDVQKLVQTGVRRLCQGLYSAGVRDEGTKWTSDIQTRQPLY